MARNVKQDTQPVVEEKDEVEGGVESPEARLMTATDTIPSFVPEAPPVVEQEETSEELPKQVWYRVMPGSPDSVMYDGGRVRMLPGKTYHSGMVDLGLLRAQGVILQEIEE